MSVNLRDNLGTRRIVKLPPPRFPDADEVVRQRAIARRRESKVDVLLVNPPSPDGDAWEYDAEYDLGDTPAAAGAPHESKDA